MKTDIVEQAALQRGRRPSRELLLAAALVLSAILWLLAWYWGTVQSIVAIWTRSETFAHGFLIVPISAWLVWNQRHIVATLNPRPNVFALPLLAAVGFGWLAGQLAGAGVVQQFGLVFMSQALVWAILGNQIVRALTFPLFFLLFAVPFGEFLEPPLMESTADFAAFAIRLSGVPLYREGQFLMLPSGNWSVVEACSGLRYLIASLTVGVLYTYLTYRTFRRRALFIAASIIVPIVANWVRAYTIIMIGHLSSMKYAVGIDHVIYGWVFFGVVMMILFWIGSFWREDLVPDKAPVFAASAWQEKTSPGAILLTTLAAAAIVAVWPAVASRLDGSGHSRALHLQAPLNAGGWQPVADRTTDWAPRFVNSRAQFNQTYAKDTAHVGLFIGYYSDQDKQSQLISSQNSIVSSTDAAWAKTGESHRTVVVANEQMPVIEAHLRGRSTRLLVWRWFWVDGQFTVNPYWAKFLQAKSALLGHGDDGAVVVVYTDQETARGAAAARLQEFTGAMLPGITDSLDHAR